MTTTATSLAGSDHGAEPRAQADSANLQRIGTSDRHNACAELLSRLKTAGYEFVTPSIATHRRILRRDARSAAEDLRDVFGWSLPFRRDLIDQALIACLNAAGMLERSGELLRSKVRVSSLGDDLFLHSAFPANADDAVFFGPDTYRFANFLREELRDRPNIDRLVDLGAGSGAGGIVAARCTRPARVVLADLNPRALELASANAQAARVAAAISLSDGLEAVEAGVDLIVANPPFIAGAGGRTYRDGGDLRGSRISLDWALASAAKLASGGRMLLYTGSAIVAGQDPFFQALQAHLEGGDVALTYRELDPDIFGAQLTAPGYGDAERIAAVGVRLDRN